MVSFVVIAASVGFMVTVDVPMYLSRWRADLALGRRFFGFDEGLDDLAHRWVVTRSWAAWLGRARFVQPPLPRPKHAHKHRGTLSFLLAISR